MHFIDFYFDPISPYSYLAFERLPDALMGTSFSVRYKPILFAALLKHHGQIGPAELKPKRDWTYRQVMWLAHLHGVALRMPAAHPFNPLPLLRLAIACARAEDACPSRYVTETILRHVWQADGADATDAARLQCLSTQLAASRDPGSDEVKAQLRGFTDEAIALGVFGVPTLVLRASAAPDAPAGRQFWGFDALPMLRACMAGDAWFASGAWEQAAELPLGITRVRDASPHP